MRLVPVMLIGCLAFSVISPATFAIANDAHHPQLSKKTKSKTIKPAKKSPRRSELPHSQRVLVPGIRVE